MRTDFKKFQRRTDALVTTRIRENFIFYLHYVEKLEKRCSALEKIVVETNDYITDIEAIMVNICRELKIELPEIKGASNANITH